MMKALVALIYGFSAWAAAGFSVYAFRRLPSGPAQDWLRCAAIAACYSAVFRLYFKRPDSLPPWTAALLTLGLIAGIDLAIFSPYFPHPWDFFLRFRNWPLPAGVALVSILTAARISKKRDNPVIGRQ